MPVSSIVHKKCPRCGKLAKELRSRTVGQHIKIITYECGHIVVEKVIKQQGYATLVSQSGHTPYKFQVDGMDFLRASNFRALLADEMGLGKTIEAIGPIKFHKEELTPFLVLCKSGLKVQMWKQIIEWLGEEFMPQIIETTNAHFMEGIPGYIISLDILRRFKNGNKKKSLQEEVNEGGHTNTSAIIDMELRGAGVGVVEDNLLEQLIKRLKIKYVILDECQLIKNHDSQRTSAVRNIAKNVDHFVALSGTPIKNHAGEYFPILNILKPERYPRKSQFEYREVASYWDGYKYKVGGLRDPAGFMAKNADFIIRRTRAEVMPDLPTVRRDFSFHEMGKEVEEMYTAKYKEFQNEYYFGEGTAFEKASNILSYINEMRQITGMAKIEPCLDFVTDFLLETDRKLTIFVHHIHVATSIELKINRMLEDGGFGYKCLRLEGGMDSTKKDDVVSSFMTGKERVLIASTLASGEGLNLQACSDCVMLERQWNPANEEQAECRFIRIGQLADKVTATYFIAVGTVDEFFTELVEQKRAIVKQTLDGIESKWDESSLIRDLADVLAAKGGKKWGW